MPKEKGPKWDHVTVLERKKENYKCKYCNHTFWGGAPRIREHFQEEAAEEAVAEASEI